ncbi:MAG TPA: hypothetical protein VHT51_21040 [Micropepsaceae bacterium]|nr:hypothetical protein [Micropepsaceae bacterium]
MSIAAAIGHAVLQLIGLNAFAIQTAAARVFCFVAIGKNGILADIGRFDFGLPS